MRVRAATLHDGGTHVARGWRPSKLPFDVDQPGSPRSLDLMKFNGSLALLMHRGLFQLDPTPRSDGLVYFHRVLAVTQRGVEEDTREIVAGGVGGMDVVGGGADGGDGGKRMTRRRGSSRRRRRGLLWRESTRAGASAVAGGVGGADQGDGMLDGGDEDGDDGGGDGGGGDERRFSYNGGDDGGTGPRQNAAGASGAPSTGRLNTDVISAISRGEKVGKIAYGNAAGLSGKSRAPLGLRALTYRITKQLYDNLPPSDPKWHYKTCAVVGNSGSLLLGAHGEEIDSHDAVLRMNNAPVGGKFLREVGQKTSFNLINFHWAKAISERTPVVERDALLLMYEATLSHLRNDVYPKLMRMHAQGSLPVIPILLSPEFVIRGYAAWLQTKDLIEQEKTAERMERAGFTAAGAGVGDGVGSEGGVGDGGGGGGVKDGDGVRRLIGAAERNAAAAHLKAAYKRKPMSGFFAMLFMLQVCDEVTMYGFSNWRPSHAKVPYHYFDHVKGTTAVHSFDLSMEVFNAVAKKFKVNLVDTE